MEFSSRFLNPSSDMIFGDIIAASNFVLITCTWVYTLLSSNDGMTLYHFRY